MTPWIVIVSNSPVGDLFGSNTADMMVLATDHAAQSGEVALNQISADTVERIRFAVIDPLNLKDALT